MFCLHTDTDRKLCPGTPDNAAPYVRKQKRYRRSREKSNEQSINLCTADDSSTEACRAYSARPHASPYGAQTAGFGPASSFLHLSDEKSLLLPLRYH